MFQEQAECDAGYNAQCERSYFQGT